MLYMFVSHNRSRMQHQVWLVGNFVLRVAMQLPSLSGWATSDVVPHTGFVPIHGSFKDCADGHSRSPASHSGGIPSNQALHAVAVDAVSIAGQGLRFVPRTQHGSQGTRRLILGFASHFESCSAVWLVFDAGRRAQAHHQGLHVEAAFFALR